MQTICITGGTKGIGKELAQLYAKTGATLIVTGRKEEELAELKETLLREGASGVFTCAADFSTDGTKRLVAFLEQHHLHPAIAILNAGLGAYGPFVDTPNTTNDTMIAVNITALTDLASHFAQNMRSTGGQILLTASTAAFQPGPGMATYFATKAYVLSFGLALREELKAHNIRVSVLCPGPTATNFSHTAEAEAAAIFNPKNTTTPNVVAKAAMRGLRNNTAIIIPGFRNKCLVFLTRLVPKTWAARIAGRALGH